MDIFLKLGWYFREKWRRYLLASLLLIAVDVLELSIPWLVGILIDQVLARSLTPESLGGYVLAVAVLLTAVLIGAALFARDPGKPKPPVSRSTRCRCC